MARILLTRSARIVHAALSLVSCVYAWQPSAVENVTDLVFAGFATKIKAPVERPELPSVAPCLDHAINVSIAPYGSDSGECGSTSRPCSLSHGVRVAVDIAKRSAAGEVRVILEDGIYSNAKQIGEPQASVVAQSGISIEIVSFGNAVLDCDMQGSALYVSITSDVKVIIRNLRFRRCTNTNSPTTWRTHPKGPTHVEAFGDAVNHTIDYAGLWFENCLWEENSSPKWAGPLQLIFYNNVSSSTFSFRNCHWISNSAGWPGGGAAWIIDAQIWDKCNTSQGCWDPSTANLTLTSTSLMFHDCTFRHTTVTGAGVISTVLGNTLMENWTIVVEDSVFDNSTLTGAGCLQIQQGWPVNSSHVDSLDWSTDANRVTVRRTQFEKCIAGWNAGFEFGAPRTSFPNSSVGHEQIGFLSFKYQTSSLFEDVTFRHNFAKKSDGGAIAFGAGTHTLNRCSFSNNSAAAVAGAIHVKTGTQVELFLTDVQFINNSAKTSGNAIANRGGGPMTLTNVSMYMVGSDSGVDDFVIEGGAEFHVNAFSSFVCPTGTVLKNPQAGATSAFNQQGEACGSTSNCYGPAKNSENLPLLTAAFERDRYLNQRKKSSVAFNLGCSFCPVTTYSVVTPALDGPFRCPCGKECKNAGDCLQGQVSDQASCQACPLGANCTAWIPHAHQPAWGVGQKEVLISANYFPYVCKKKYTSCSSVLTGYHSSKKSDIESVQCPKGYCCSRSEGRACPWNRPCETNREGILCGDCVKGTSASFGASKCVHNEDCHSWWYMIPLYILLLLAYAHYLAGTGSKTYSLIDQVIFYYQVFPYALPRWTNRSVVIEVFARILSFNPTMSADSSSSFAAKAGCLFRGMTPLYLKGMGFVTAAILSALVGLLVLARSKTRRQRIDEESQDVVILEDTGTGIAIEAAHSSRIKVSAHNFRTGDKVLYSPGGQNTLKDEHGFDIGEKIFNVRVDADDITLLELSRPGLLPCMPESSQTFLPQANAGMGRLILEEHHLFKSLEKTFLFVYSTIITDLLALVSCKRIPGLGLRLFISGSVVCYRPWQYGLWVIFPFVLMMPFTLALLGADSGALTGFFSRGRRAQLRQGALHSKASRSRDFQEHLWWWPYYLAFLRGVLGMISAIFVEEASSAVTMTFVLFCILVVHIWLRPHKKDNMQHLQSLLWLLLALLATSTIGPAYLMTVGTQAQGSVGEDSTLVKVWNTYVFFAKVFPGLVLCFYLMHTERAVLYRIVVNISNRCCSRNAGLM